MSKKLFAIALLSVIVMTPLASALPEDPSAMGQEAATDVVDDLPSIWPASVTIPRPYVCMERGPELPTGQNLPRPVVQFEKCS